VCYRNDNDRYRKSTLNADSICTLDTKQNDHETLLLNLSTLHKVLSQYIFYHGHRERRSLTFRESATSESDCCLVAMMRCPHHTPRNIALCMAFTAGTLAAPPSVCQEKSGKLQIPEGQIVRGRFESARSDVSVQMRPIASADLPNPSPIAVMRRHDGLIWVATLKGW
jgi:hypothetical protein